MPASATAVSVVICTLDRPKELLSCLRSVALQTVTPLEILVVDASSDWKDHTLQYQQAVGQISLQHLAAKPGLTAQRNAGVQLSASDVVLFLDDDVILDANYVAAIRATFDLDPTGSVAGVEGEFTNNPYAHGRQAWKSRLWRWLFLQGGQTPKGGYMLRSGRPVYRSRSEGIVPVEVSCGITAYRRTVLQQFLLDEHLDKYAWMEDADLSYRVTRNHRIYHTPFARLAHYPSAKARLKPKEMAAMRVYNHCYLFEKNMPQTLFNQACFLWANLGTAIYQLLRGTKEEMLGLVSGYRRAYQISRNRVPRDAASGFARNRT